MRKFPLSAIFVLVVAIALLGFGLIGCGSSDQDRHALRATYAAFPDSLDPALSVTVEGWTTMQNVYLPLLTYAHEDGAAGTKLVPALARSLPRISDDGRRYTLYLRKGLEYSDGRPVRASDFPFVVERLFRSNSPGSPFYTGIVGAERFAETKEGGISGIVADDESGRIVIRLQEPRGTFSNELGLLYVALLPQGTPDEDQTKDPPPATGPYQIVSSRPGRSMDLARNPAWAAANAKAMPDLPGGHLDEIKIDVVTNPSAQVNSIEQGRSDWMRNPPPPDRLAEVKRTYEGTQYREQATISNFYFWMNTREPPFDDVLVRRAVNHAIDPSALERIYAGTLRAQQQVLPPGMPGHEEFSPYPHDLAQARRLIARADPDDRRVTVWTNDSPPNTEAGEYYEDVLQSLGFRTKLRAVDTAVYFGVIGNEATPDLDTGWGNWLLDYPHPNDYFQPQLAGESILAENSTNWARFDDPRVNAAIARLATRQLGEREVEEYAALDRAVMRRAPWAPFGLFTVSTFVSEGIDLEEVVVSPIFGHDLTSFQFE